MKKIYTICLLSVFSNNLLAQCYTAVKTIGSTTIALQTDGTLWSWGNNSSGILGTGNENLTAINVPKAQIGTDNNWSTKFNFIGHALALKNDGTLWAWGSNHQGQCGNGTSGGQNLLIAPEQITTDTWLDVGVGSDSYSLGVKSDGTLWAWGRNDQGQLGTGNNTFYIIPTQIGTDTNWAKVFCGSATSFAIKTDGSLWVWGYNALTIFGSTIGNSTIPGRIGTANNWMTAAPTNGLSVLALKTDGTLWIWGQNQSSSFHAYYGNGYPDMGNYENNPTQIGTDTDWQSIGATQENYYAIKNNGTLWDWGINYNGELGDGTTTPKYFPTQIGTDNNWERIATRGNRIYAIKGNSIYRWGYFANPTTVTPVLYGTDCALGTASFYKENTLVVFPNPTTDKINLRLEVSLLPTASIIITNFLGQTVTSIKSPVFSLKEFTIDCSAYANGIYLIRLKNGDEVYTTKISKH